MMKHAHRELSVDAQFENVAKAGQLIPGLEVEIVDEAFRPLPHDGESTGEILIRGPWVCSEYYRNPQPERFRDDWLLAIRQTA
ncbi:MAG: AMP-binding protein [Gammaproteobacteria bacterium]|nr:AMP-binding protein [Gammaproteobacteria bacterium]